MHPLSCFITGQVHSLQVRKNPNAPSGKFEDATRKQEQLATIAQPSVPSPARRGIFRVSVEARENLAKAVEDAEQKKDKEVTPAKPENKLVALQSSWSDQPRTMAEMKIMQPIRFLDTSTNNHDYFLVKYFDQEYVLRVTTDFSDGGVFAPFTGEVAMVKVPNSHEVGRKNTQSIRGYLMDLEKNGFDDIETENGDLMSSEIKDTELGAQLIRCKKQGNAYKPDIDATKTLFRDIPSSAESSSLHRSDEDLRGVEVRKYLGTTEDGWSYWTVASMGTKPPKEPRGGYILRCHADDDKLVSMAMFDTEAEMKEAEEQDPRKWVEKMERKNKFESIDIPGTIYDSGMTTKGLRTRELFDRLLTKYQTDAAEKTTEARDRTIIPLDQLRKATVFNRLGNEGKYDYFLIGLSDGTAVLRVVMYEEQNLWFRKLTTEESNMFNDEKGNVTQGMKWDTFQNRIKNTGDWTKIAKTGWERGKYYTTTDLKNPGTWKSTVWNAMVRMKEAAAEGKKGK